MFAVLTFSFISVGDQPACSKTCRLARHCKYGTIIYWMNVSSDQPALYMAIPAPARFTDLREHLHTAGIDAAYLCLTLEQYLNLPDNMPTHDWMLDPHEDHQAWEYRQNLNNFREMIVDKPDEGNGDEDNEDDIAS